LNTIAHNNLKDETDRIWLGISDVWLTTQVILQGVYRWGRFKRIKIRPQNDLQHSYSVTILAAIFLEKISKYHLNLDKELILKSFLVHDHGEGELKRDYCVGAKKPIHDVEEYIAFNKRYGQLEAAVYSSLEHAYLLQHATLEDRTLFPSMAQEILGYLFLNKYQEALCFTAIQTWDYLLYALEQNRNNPGLIILPEVAKNQIPVMNDLAKKLPGFREEIWTDEIASLFNKILE